MLILHYIKNIIVRTNCKIVRNPTFTFPIILMAGLSYYSILKGGWYTILGPYFVASGHIISMANIRGVLKILSNLTIKILEYFFHIFIHIHFILAESGC